MQYCRATKTDEINLALIPSRAYRLTTGVVQLFWTHDALIEKECKTLVLRSCFFFGRLWFHRRDVPVIIKIIYFCGSHLTTLQIWPNVEFGRRCCLWACPHIKRQRLIILKINMFFHLSEEAPQAELPANPSPAYTLHAKRYPTPHSVHRS